MKGLNRPWPSLFGCCCVVVLVVLVIDKSSAQQTTHDEGWGFLIEPSLLFPNMAGVIGAGSFPDAPVDADVGEIFSKLQFGGELVLEAHTNDWAFTSDLVYMHLEQGVTPGELISSGEASAKQLVWEMAGFYRLATFLEGGIGGRLNSLETGLNLQRKVPGGDTAPESGGHSKAWFDPILVARAEAGIDNEWVFQFQGDIGGFGVGSKFTWQIQGYAGYKFSNLLHVSAGYRVLGIDYEETAGEDRFRYDMNIFGPVVKIGFSL